MGPFDLPARDALRLPAEIAPAWAIFEPAWYRARYGATTELPPDDALLAYYLESGQSAGHSPNRFFDETWHRRAYPAIQTLIKAGAFTSAFDSYCRAGHRDRSPHWLFDEIYYRDRHPDLTNEAFRAGGLANGYDHFLRHGDREGRRGHILFDPDFYRTTLSPDEQTAAAESGYFHDYLLRLERRAPERRTTCYFDCVWYVRRYPEVGAALAEGRWQSALEHYLCNDTPGEFDPLLDFSEGWYLRNDPGLRTVIEHGDFRNGYTHFLRHGAVELRSPAEHVDLAWYASLDSVRGALARGDVPDAFTHWLTTGRSGGLPVAPPPDTRIHDGQARSLFRYRAMDMLPLYGRMPLRFDLTEPPVLSVVMVVEDSLAMTLMTLAYLRNNVPPATELIIVDPGLDPDTRALGLYVTGAVVARIEGDVGWLQASNAGMACARAPYCLLLRSGTELVPGAVIAGLRRITTDPTIGAVGGKIVQPHGVLLQAGGLILRDGATHDYMRDASPAAPEVNFVRSVHFCSSSCLLVRSETILEIGGFDAQFTAGGHADADLCLRLAGLGYRIIYEPNMIAWCWEPEPTPSSATIDRFVEVHQTFLANCYPPDGGARVFARTAGPAPHRILFIEDMIPIRSIGSGFVRSNDIIRTMVGMGCAVTVFPINDSGFGLAGVHADLPDEVEIMYDHALLRLAEFLLLRRGYYDTIWIARTHNLQRALPALEKILADTAAPPRIVLDTEAIGSVREAEQAALAGKPFNLGAALLREFAHAGLCQAIVAVSAQEAAILRELGSPNIHIVGHVRTPRPGSRTFTQRSGLLFAGAIHKMDSPNYDSLCWMIEDVLPIVEQSLGWETRLTIAGYTSPDVSLDRFKGYPRVSLRGVVPDLEPLYASHRVFVAPTRFAAGAPYKVHEAASFGVPIVATTLLRRQLDWEDGREILAADATDAAAFAARIVQLYRDEALWDQIRMAALNRLETEHNPADYREAIHAALHADVCPVPG